MKRYTGTQDLSDVCTTISISGPAEDTPLPSKEEQDEEIIRSVAEDIHSIKGDATWIGLVAFAVLICQIAQCAHAVMK